MLPFQQFSVKYSVRYKILLFCCFSKMGSLFRNIRINLARIKLSEAIIPSKMNGCLGVQDPLNFTKQIKFCETPFVTISLSPCYHITQAHIS